MKVVLYSPFFFAGGGWEHYIGWSTLIYQLLYLLRYKLCVCVKVESVARETVNPSSWDRTSPALSPSPGMGRVPNIEDNVQKMEERSSCG